MQREPETIYGLFSSVRQKLDAGQSNFYSESQRAKVWSDRAVAEVWDMNRCMLCLMLPELHAVSLMRHGVSLD